MPIDSSILALIAGGATLILLVWVIILEVRLRRLLRGKNGGSLEDIIHTVVKEQKDIRALQTEMERYLTGAERRLRKSMQGTAVVRFNAFKDGSGGNQSFALAIVNEEDTGFVISSLYARDRVSVFSKPIKNGASPYELSTEERQALQKARERISV